MHKGDPGAGDVDTGAGSDEQGYTGHTLKCPDVSAEIGLLDAQGPGRTVKAPMIGGRYSIAQLSDVDRHSGPRSLNSRLMGRLIVMRRAMRVVVARQLARVMIRGCRDGCPGHHQDGKERNDRSPFVRDLIYQGYEVAMPCSCGQCPEQYIYGRNPIGWRSQM